MQPAARENQTRGQDKLESAGARASRPSHLFPVRFSRPHHQPHFLGNVICDLAKELFEFITHVDLTPSFVLTSVLQLSLGNFQVYVEQ